MATQRRSIGRYKNLVVNSYTQKFPLHNTNPYMVIPLKTFIAPSSLALDNEGAHNPSESSLNVSPSFQSVESQTPFYQNQSSHQECGLTKNTPSLSFARRHYFGGFGG